MTKLKNVRSASKFDVALGERVRAMRQEGGLSQNALADVIGVSFQQVQKYERGANRISVSRLMLICRALKTPITRVLEGL